VCQAGAGSVKMGGQTGVSKVVQDVLESAIRQSLVNTACVCHICSTVLKNAKCLAVCVITYEAPTLL